jgi:hypothetical protein
LIELVWNERGGKSPKAETLSNGIGIIDVALSSVGEGFLESLNQAGIENIDLGLEGGKLRERS